MTSISSSILAALLHGEQPPTTKVELNAIGRLKREKLIESSGVRGSTTYRLTTLGRINALLQAQQENTESFMRANENYLLTHDISGVPDHLLVRIGELNGVLGYDTTQPMATITGFFQRVEKSTWIRGVSGHIMPGYTDMFGNLARKGADVELILSVDVIQDLPKVQLDNVLSLPNFYLYEIKSARVGLCCMDSGLSLGFPVGDRYDIASDLICGPGALPWGLELFEWYKKQAREIK